MKVLDWPKVFSPWFLDRKQGSVPGRLTRLEDPILSKSVKMLLDPNLGLARNVVLPLANKNGSWL
jgi:hypothetical protein